MTARAKLETLRMCECIDSREWKDEMRPAATIAEWRREIDCTGWAWPGTDRSCAAARCGVSVQWRARLEVWLELRECEADALLVAIEDGEKFAHEHVAEN